MGGGGGGGGGGEGVTPLYKPYRYVPPQRVSGLSSFASNMTKLSVNEAKWSSLQAGTFEKRAPGLKMGVEDEIFCLK